MYTPNLIPSNICPIHNLTVYTIFGYFALEPTANEKYATTQDKKTSDYLEN